MNLPTTAVILNRRRLANKSGKYPVHIRITIGRQSKYRAIPTPEKVSKEQWSGIDDYWVKLESKTFLAYSLRLLQIVAFQSFSRLSYSVGLILKLTHSLDSLISFSFLPFTELLQKLPPPTPDGGASQLCNN